MSEIQKRSGVVAVVGRTNVGKSTLINRIMGEKISIVSPVVQTTRNLIRGVLTEERGQLVMVDTPGLHRARTELGKRMNRMARGSIEGADLVMLMFDAGVKPRMEDDGWLRRVLFSDQPVLFVLNKCDCIPSFADLYREMWQAVQEEKGQTRDVEWHSVSATNGDGVVELTECLFNAMVEGPLLFPEEMLSDYPRKLAMADVIREKLFQQLHDEIPHGIAVWIEEIDESPDEWKVQTIIYVNRPSHKGIVIGKKGRVLRRARREAEQELSDVFERRVRLDLWIKVEKNWSENFWMLRKLGYA